MPSGMQQENRRKIIYERKLTFNISDMHSSGHCLRLRIFTIAETRVNKLFLTVFHLLNYSTILNEKKA